MILPSAVSARPCVARRAGRVVREEKTVVLGPVWRPEPDIAVAVGPRDATAGHPRPKDLASSSRSPNRPTGRPRREMGRVRRGEGARLLDRQPGQPGRRGLLEPDGRGDDGPIPRRHDYAEGDAVPVVVDGREVRRDRRQRYFALNRPTYRSSIREEDEAELPMSIMTNTHDLPADLRALQLETEQHARDFGLDFYDTVFEVLDYDELSEIAALGGFPTRYPHWRFGMEYQQLSKGYRYGLQKIYEMVINNDPCYAYLLRCNQMVDQKLVMAHVYGHNDFFKNNAFFGHTSRKMMDETANHGNRIRSYMERLRRGRRRELHRQLPLAGKPHRRPLHRHQAARGPQRPPPVRRRRRGGRDVVEVPVQGLHGLVRQPPRVPQGAAEAEGGREAEGQAVPRTARARRPAVPAGTRPAQPLAARRAGDRPRGGVLLRPPGPDQDHERGLGVVLALDDHDHPDPPPLGTRRLRRPPLGDDGHPARPAQPVQARDRAVPRHRGALEQGAVRPRVRGVRRLRDPPPLGQAARASAARRSSRSAGSTPT